jgi:hypothetical protein
MKETDIKLHLAAQYLATVGKNYIEAQSDDSHTNLGWIDEISSFCTRKLSNGDVLELRACSMVLNWNGMSAGTFNLNGSMHKDVVDWLDSMAKSNGLDSYVFDLHYTIDSGEFTDELSFSSVDDDRCNALAQLRSYAYKACEGVLEELSLSSDVRTWPHHFDTGSFVTIGDSEVSIGFGLAIPDTVMSDYYLYVSAYKGHDALSTNGFPALSKGTWKDEDWMGARLLVDGLSAEDYLRFFEESMTAIIERTKQKIA